MGKNLLFSSQVFGDVTLPAVTERAGARTMGWVEVGPPSATMNARYNHNYLPDGDMMSFALHKIKRKLEYHHGRSVSVFCSSVSLK